MNLVSLGFDDWFAKRVPAQPGPGRCYARVTAVDRDAFLVRNAAADVHAELAGRLRFETRSAAALPCVGDWVVVQWPDAGGPGVIHEVLPRRTFLARKRPGKSADMQMIAANIDVAFIVQGCPYDFNVARLERYLAMAHEGGIEPRIVLTKTDLISPDEREDLLGRIRASGIDAPVLPVSNATGEGVDAFRAGLVPGRTYGLLGSSGVGKTTLLNRLLGREMFETRAVSGTGEGVHTTSRRQLLVLDGGALLVDTPGMRELGLLGTGDGVDAAFDDIGAYAARCRFPDCSHTREPGCAVLAALETGDLAEARYRSYLKLRREAEFHSMTHLEKRRKDRAFGKFVKSALKESRGRKGAGE